MVFLGGAVLANIVSYVQGFCALNWELTSPHRWQTRRTCGYRSRSGRSKGRVH